jgi:transcriptional regulator with XRE-family HTH domain
MTVSTHHRFAAEGAVGDLRGPGAVGANLRHLSGMHDISQRDLARYLGLSVQGVWNILHGRSEPRLRTAERIAAAFAIPIDCLFADTGSCVRAAAGVFEHAPIRAFAGSLRDEAAAG